MIKKILLGLLAIFLILQIFQIDKNNPSYDAQQDYLSAVDVPDNLRALLKDACYDCHSHETKYPWYSYVQPVGWWLKDHVKDGKKHLNFSEWMTYAPKKAKHKLEECFEELENGAMPLKPYRFTHAEARLSDEQRQELVTWFKNQYNDYPLD